MNKLIIARNLEGRAIKFLVRQMPHDVPVRLNDSTKQFGYRGYTVEKIEDPKLYENDGQ